MKNVTALTLLIAIGASAHAQSTVTLFGVLDATLQYGKGTAGNKFGMGNGGSSPTRFGLRGTEDLGGGLAASFWLESGFNNDDGTAKNNNFNGSNITNNQFGTVPSVADGLKFARRSTVSLSSTSLGEVRLGRDFSTQYLSVSIYDPFGDNGVGATLLDSSLGLGGPPTVRVSNAVSYLSPSFGGVYGQVQGYTGENAAGAAATASSAAIGKSDGRGFGGRIGFRNGPIDVALAIATTKYLANGNIETTNIGAAYDLDYLKVMAVYSQDKVEAPGNLKGRGYLLGFTAPIGQGVVRLAYSSYKREVVGLDPEARKVSLGYVYNISKRTAIYTTYAHLKNKNNSGLVLNGALLTTRSDNVNGVDVGLRHTF